jgi:uncharacterized peroxidase-related enzyme
MQTLKSIDPTTATGKTKQIFDGFQKKLGVVPNLVQVLANSPAALSAYVGFGAALSQGTLSGQAKEQIAIAVANANSCEYCLSAHTALGQLAGLAADELVNAKTAEATDPKTAAALRFAVKVIQQRGKLPASEVEALRTAGYTDAEVVEIIALVVENIFTNYFNHIAGTDIDFPVVHATETL